MNSLRTTYFITAIALISGCATTGGTIGGLFPAPKILKGNIGNNIYTAKNKMFTISIPHQERTYEYNYMQLKEQYKNNEAYVSFGPAAFNHSIYRINVIVHPESGKNTMPLNTAAPQVMENYKKQMVKNYGTSPKVLEKKKIKINNKNTYYWKLTQDIPAGKSYSNKNKVFNHYIYVVDYEIAAGIFWIRIPSDTGSREAGIAPKKFVESLKLMTNKSLQPTATRGG